MTCVFKIYLSKLHMPFAVDSVRPLHLPVHSWAGGPSTWFSPWWWCRCAAHQNITPASTPLYLLGFYLTKGWPCMFWSVHQRTCLLQVTMICSSCQLLLRLQEFIGHSNDFASHSGVQWAEPESETGLRVKWESSPNKVRLPRFKLRNTAVVLGFIYI